jgi:hypothetical protein
VFLKRAFWVAWECEIYHIKYILKLSDLYARFLDMKTLEEIFVCRHCNKLGVAWCDYDDLVLVHCQDHVDIFLSEGGGLDFIYPLLDRKVTLPDLDTPRPETWVWEMSAPYASVSSNERI